MKKNTHTKLVSQRLANKLTKEVNKLPEPKQACAIVAAGLILATISIVEEIHALYNFSGDARPTPKNVPLEVTSRDKESHIEQAKRAIEELRRSDEGMIILNSLIQEWPEMIHTVNLYFKNN